MLITILCVLGLAVGIALFVVYNNSDDNNDGAFVGGLLCSVVGGLGTLVCFGAIISANISINGTMADYHALETSLQLARANQSVSSVELAAIQQQVITFNRELAVDQYWAKTPWTNWFYSKRIFEINPIR